MTPAQPIAAADGERAYGGCGNYGAYGLYPASAFRLTTGETASGNVLSAPDHSALPQAQWYFRQQTIAIPVADVPVAGFERLLLAQKDLRAWCDRTPPGSALEYPTLVWVGSPQVVESAQLGERGDELLTDGQSLGFLLAPRLESNRSYFNAASLAFFRRRYLRVRGESLRTGLEQPGRFVANGIWPDDFRLDPAATLQPVAATREAIRAFVRQDPSAAEQEKLSTRLIWQRDPHAAQQRAGRPLIGLMLNGAQGDDDEAHGGHFGLLTGRVGENGEMHDWLMANFYTLDSESEKGILSAMLPLDHYLADLNSGQSWYRPSWMLVATLRHERTATHLSSALARVFNQFYRHQFLYRHATDNCAGICLSTLRTLGWHVPVLGVTSWWKAFAALVAVSLGSRSLAKGKAMFDYFTEERTRLFPALAFEQAGADLLKLVNGQAGRVLTPFEALLSEDVEEILLVHVPQLPSSRAWGTSPVISIAEYQARLPKDPRQQQIIPVAPRPFPPALKDPLAPPLRRQRSGYVVAALMLGIPLLTDRISRSWRQRRQRSGAGNAECDHA